MFDVRAEEKEDVMLHPIRMLCATLSLISVSLTTLGNVETAPITPLPAVRNHVQGVFLRSVSGNRFQVLVGSEPNTYDLASSARVTRDGNPTRLADLTSGDQVTLYLHQPMFSLVRQIEAFSRRP